MKAVDMIGLLCNSSDLAEAAMLYELRGESSAELREEVKAICGCYFLLGEPQAGHYVLFYSGATDMPQTTPDFISVLEDGQCVLFYRIIESRNNDQNDKEEKCRI